MAGQKSSISVVLLIIYLHQFVPLVSSASLYNPDDPLWELDSSNFQRIVLGKNNAWIIEFYNSWCGHCIRFAPIWVEFAKDIKNWANVIEVGVVNCAETDNVKLCRDYSVNSYPTVKLFPVNINETVKGESLTGERDVVSMRQTVISYLEMQSNDGVPSGWPILKPLDIEHTGELWNKLPGLTTSTVFILVETPDSIIGREIILDISAKKHIVIRRVLTTNTPLLKELINENNITSSLPLLLKIEKDGTKEILHRFTNKDNDTFVRDKVFEIITGLPRDDNIEKVVTDKPIEDKGLLSKGVYMKDLENAVRYALRQEVGVHEDISGPKLVALKSFVSALKMYFPGNATVFGYLTKLNNWIMHRKDNISGEVFLNAMDKFQTDVEFLPAMHEWVGCKGSQPKYRGYPCSLWTLFHTLTVGAYDMYEDNTGHMREDPRKVLSSISGYIKHFFTCHECSKHFQEMAENLEQELHSPQDTVLWLWNAHNKVNLRLAGDVTEDPQHHKIQFPSLEKCPKCRITNDDSDQNIQWDMKAVLRYLQYFYGKKNIITVNDDSYGNTIHIRTHVNVKNSMQRKMIEAGDFIQENPRVISFTNTSFLEKWNFRWFTSTDVSLCVSLYFVSALLLVIIYLLFTQRRKRRKARFAKYINMYP